MSRSMNYKLNVLSSSRCVDNKSSWREHTDISGLDQSPKWHINLKCEKRKFLFCEKCGKSALEKMKCNNSFCNRTITEIEPLIYPKSSN